MVEPEDGGGRKSDFALFEGRRKERGEEEKREQHLLLSTFLSFLSLVSLSSLSCFLVSLFSFSRFSSASFSLRLEQLKPKSQKLLEGGWWKNTR